MQGALSRGESPDLEVHGQAEDTPAVAPEQLTLSKLAGDEVVVLDALAACPTGATLGRLRSRCGLSDERLLHSLEQLRNKGLVVRLNTVVESYRCRFPGIRVE